TASALGKQLYLKVSDLSDNNGKPEVSPTASIREVLITITKYRLGATAVIGVDEILGIITDGDIRRMLEKHEDVTHLTANDIMTRNPKEIKREELAADALHIMRQHNISQLLVTQEGHYTGIIHLQDLLKEGII